LNFEGGFLTHVGSWERPETGNLPAWWSEWSHGAPSIRRIGCLTA
jgi:hypothetical protein